MIGVHKEIGGKGNETERQEGQKRHETCLTVSNEATGSEGRCTGFRWAIIWVWRHDSEFLHHHVVDKPLLIGRKNVDHGFRVCFREPLFSVDFHHFLFFAFGIIV